MEQQLCACGCGQIISNVKSRGNSRQFYSKACKQRYHRNKLAENHFNGNDSVTIKMAEVLQLLEVSSRMEKEGDRVDIHIRRALRMSLSATLSLEEWLSTLDHFGWLCAYCRTQPFEVLEHFVPLGLGGGTTVTNCVPACSSCNAKKRNYNPYWEEANTGMGTALLRVREYLQTCSRTYKPRKEVDAILRYPGAKWSKAKWITSYFPKHRTYIEPFAGSAACFFQKSPSEYEILNDLSGDIVHLFRVLRSRGEELAYQINLTPWARVEYDASFERTEDELERARRFLVRCWQAHGTKTNTKTGWKHRGPSGSGSTTQVWKQLPDRLMAASVRLKETEITNEPALDIITEYNAEDVLLYVDPPYMLSTRSGAMYEHEMTNEQHVHLLDVLKAHCGSVVLSGYAHTLYENSLIGWERVSSSSVAEKGQTRTEVLWLNPIAVSHQQLSLFEA